MKNLLIIGARGLGREIYNLAIKCGDYNTEWRIAGFLDDNAAALEGYTGYPPVIGPVEDYVPQGSDVFVCALGNVTYKQKYAGMILAKGGEFINLVHPLANIHENVTLGKGVIISAFSFISNEVTLGDFVTVQSHVAIGHDTVVGDWCQLNAMTFLGGFCHIGPSVSINVGVTVIDRITIGENAVIGAGSAVIRKVKPGVTVFGNPAREI